MKLFAPLVLFLVVRLFIAIFPSSFSIGHVLECPAAPVIENVSVSLNELVISFYDLKNRPEDVAYYAVRYKKRDTFDWMQLARVTSPLRLPLDAVTTYDIQIFAVMSGNKFPSQSPYSDTFTAITGKHGS